MKKITIIMCTLLLVVLTGCGVNKNNFKIGEKSSIEIVNNDVTLSVKASTLTPSGATFVMKNNSDKSFQYGLPWELEIKQNAEWHKIDVVLIFNLPAFELNAHDSKEFKINWENSYGKLAKGKYRFIKHINYEYEEGKFEKFYISADFEIK